MSKPLTFGLVKRLDLGSNDEDEEAPQGSKGEKSTNAVQLDVYDEVYDEMKQQTVKDAKSSDKRPKYMQNLINAARQRRKDQLIAKDRAIQRERELEDQQYADKETFVTNSYKRQQVELAKFENESKLQEKADLLARSQSGGGITRLYQTWLEQDDENHQAIVSKTLLHKEKSEAVLTKSQESLDKAQGLDVILNDNDEIVNKRQLLSAGLNIRAKSNVKKFQSPQEIQNNYKIPSHVNNKRAQQIERQNLVIYDQLQISKKRKAQQELAKHQAILEQSKSSHKDISGYVERYLARKSAEQSFN